MRDGLDEARALLPGVHLTELARLGGSERSAVRRVRAQWPDERTTTLIVKRFTGAGEGWVRESAALSMLPPDRPAPHVVADCAAPPIVIMADLGAGPTVAKALLGDDVTAASDAVAGWSEAVARLHRITLGQRERFRAELRGRAGEWPVADAVMSTTVDEVVPVLADQCERLGVSVPGGAFGQLREVPRQLALDAAGALTPSDTCPDNNVRVGERTVLLDFEGAQWRHVAWDVAYLTVPWPTCWCSWRMPREVAERAFEHYRRTVEDALPYVRTPQFRADIATAALGWAFISTAWFLPRALGDDPPPEDPAKVTPTRRAMILHRLDGARRATAQPALAELAARLRTTLVGRWGEVPLAYAPAFDTNS